MTDENAKDSFWVQSRNRLFKRLIEKNTLTGKTKFLEIGCGTGDFISHLVSNPQLDITGSEIYLKGLVYAKKNIPQVEFVQFDVTKGKIGDKFDMIAAFDVLEHIDNDVAAISNIYQMLNKDGIFIVSVPQYMFLWSNLDEIVKHKRRYSKSELLTKLKQNNFEINYTTSFVFTLFPLMLVSRLFDKKSNQPASNENGLEKRVKFSGLMNRIFNAFMRIDEALIKWGVSLPFGGTLVVVARKC